jgi:hypothetical protein
MALRMDGVRQPLDRGVCGLRPDHRGDRKGQHAPLEPVDSQRKSSGDHQDRGGDMDAGVELVAEEVPATVEGGRKAAGDLPPESVRHRDARRSRR